MSINRLASFRGTIACVSSPGPDSVSVATWNLWWKFGPWEERQTPIGDELAELDADIVCIQEVWSTDDGDQAVILAERLGRDVARTVDADGRPHSFGNAVLSRWPILEQHSIALPGEDGQPGHRSALLCRIDVPGAAVPWWVVSTHLEWRYTASALRERQLEAVVAEIIERTGAASGAAAERPVVVLAGDFNAVAESDEIRRLTGLAAPYDERLMFIDSWPAVRSDAGATWTRANPHSQFAQWPERRLDAVFVAWPRPKPTGNALAAELFGLRARSISAESDTEIVPSDHYGVIAEIDARTEVPS